MKKNELKSLIKETINEVSKEDYSEGDLVELIENNSQVDRAIESLLNLLEKKLEIILKDTNFDENDIVTYLQEIDEPSPIEFLLMYVIGEPI